jgi:pimeloyl-ACP methyl ester carboxylesterase
MHVPRKSDLKARCTPARRWAGWMAALVVAVAAIGAPGGAARALGQDDKKDEPVAPQDVTLKTRDGVTIVATYYGSHEGKNALPIILLHAAKGSRGDFRNLALTLQKAGHAVIAPDLRGHGDSTTMPDDRAAELQQVDVAAMVSQDVEAVKNYLIERNNAAELNIDKLCLVGPEMGSVVALNFAARDWSWPPLATGKQGQDVKALVLISPEWTHRGVRINDAIAHPQVQSQLSVLIVAGKNNATAVREARRLFTAFERFHAPPKPGDEEAQQMIWMRTPSTRLQGTELVNERRAKVDELIVEFIDARVASQKIPWYERRNPL